MRSSLVRLMMVLGLASALAGCGAGARDAAGEYEVAEVYQGLRSRVLDLRPGELTPRVEGPLALLMETGHEEGVATLVAVADGTVSLYFSNGGGMIGSGAVPEVWAVAETLLRDAAGAAAKMQPAADRALPARDRVRFYLVGADGVRTAEASQDDLGNGRHELSPLFHSSHRLIAAMREHSEKVAR